MRVHHIINSYSLHAGGAERLVRRLHSGIRERGIESFLFGLIAHDEPQVQHALSAGLQTPYSINSFLKLMRYFIDYVKPNDIVHAHLSPCLFYCATAKRLLRWPGPLVSTEHHTTNNRRGKLHGRLLDRLTYPMMSTVVCISKGARDALEKWMPCTYNRTLIIPNGIESRFEVIPERIEKPILSLLSVGRLHPSKNYSTILQALVGLKREWEYQIAGDGPLQSDLERLTHELGIAERVRFLGHVPDVAPLLSKADIFLIPSAWEGFGLAAVEAMDAGLPIIASDIPGLQELSDPKSPSLILVDPNNPGSITRELLNLADSPQLRKQLGKRAFGRAKLYTLDQCIEKHICLYENLFVL